MMTRANDDLFKHLDKALGVEFAGPGNEMLRFLLRPSFEPNLCLTFFQREDSAVVHLAAFQELPADRLAKGRIFLHSEEHTFPLKRYEQILDLARQVLTAEEDEEQRLILDGMPFTIWLVEREQAEVLEGHACGETLLVQPVREALQTAYAIFTKPACKNAVAVAGRYAGLNLKVIDIPEVSTTTNLLILGPEEDANLLSHAMKRL